MNYIYYFEIEPIRNNKYLEWGRDRGCPIKCDIIEKGITETMVKGNFFHVCILISYCT
jgi:hypothetical protein